MLSTTPISTRVTGEMAAGHRAVARQPLGAGIGVGNARLTQTHADLLRTPIAPFGLFRQQRHQRRVRDVHAQSNDMDLMIFPQRRDFHPVDQPQW